MTSECINMGEKIRVPLRSHEDKSVRNDAGYSYR